MTGRVLDMKECATDHTEDKQHESQESDSLDSIEYLSSDNDSDNDGKKPVKKGEGVHPPCTNVNKLTKAFRYMQSTCYDCLDSVFLNFAVLCTTPS